MIHVVYQAVFLILTMKSRQESSSIEYGFNPEKLHLAMLTMAVTICRQINNLGDLGIVIL